MSFYLHRQALYICRVWCERDRVWPTMRYHMASVVTERTRTRQSHEHKKRMQTSCTFCLPIRCLHRSKQRAAYACQLPLLWILHKTNWSRNSSKECLDCSCTFCLQLCCLHRRNQSGVHTVPVADFPQYCKCTSDVMQRLTSASYTFCLRSLISVHMTAYASVVGEHNTLTANRLYWVRGHVLNRRKIVSRCLRA